LIIEPIPEPTPEPEPTLDIQPSTFNPVPLPEPTLDIQPSTFDPPPVPEPTLDIQPSTFDVGTLSDTDLKAAASLYARKNQKALSQKGVEKRQAIAKENLSNIKAFISSHSPANNRTIARALNLPPRRVQHYMQILTHNGTVTATGWGASREYFKK